MNVAASCCLKKHQETLALPYLDATPGTDPFGSTEPPSSSLDAWSAWETHGVKLAMATELLSSERLWRMT